MTTTSAALLVGGLAVLVVGGEVLVRGASGVARALGMSPLLVGLTVVAFATSAPELAVSLGATLGGTPGLAVGNVVGSNIANVLLVLGLSAVVLPVIVGRAVVRRDVPAVAIISLLMLGVSLDLRISRADGIVLITALVAYLVVTVLAARREDREQAGAQAAPARTAAPTAPAGTAGTGRLARDGVLVAVGVGLLVVGADWLVAGATQVARSLGVSDLIIGLTVVAVGTSLPELATSLIAAARGERDMAVGNVVGSCMFNLGAVLGLSAVVAGGGIPVDPAAVRFDIPFMVATALALLPVAFTGLAIARWEGIVLVAYYAAYLAFLVLTATDHPALPAFGAAMRLFVIPLTVLTLAVVVVQEVGARRGRGAGLTRPFDATGPEHPR